MEFWGVEVKAGEPRHVAPENGELIHISQVALGEVKNLKSANIVPVRLTVDDKKFVIGTLSAEKVPQIMFDLVLEKDFTLSHDWKDGSLYFCGYTAPVEQDDEGPFGNEFSDEEEDESEDEEIAEEGKPVADAQATVPAKSKAAAAKQGTSAKPKVTLVEPKKEDSDDSEGSDEDSDDESEDDLDDDSDDDMSEDEETPKKVESSKKRPSSSEIKTPASTKKSKTETPQKTAGKKGAHTATPHPAKKSEKKAVETPKSSGQVTCNSCSKTFNSEKGLESHSKAKHGGK